MEPLLLVQAVVQGWGRQKVSSLAWLVRNRRSLRERRRRVQAAVTSPGALDAHLVSRIEPPMVAPPPGMGAGQRRPVALLAPRAAGRRPMTLTAGSFRLGTIKVAVGVASFGLANYVFLAGATRLLGPVRFAEFNVFWGLVYGLGLGLCLPFEQEVSRRAAVARASGEDPAPTLRAAYRTTALATAALAVATVPVAFVFARREDVAQVVVLCAVSYLALAVAYVSRGALSGSGQFGRYAAQFGVEGALRVAAVGLVAASVIQSSVVTFALAVPVALLAGVFATTRIVVRGRPTLGVGVLGRSLGPMVVSSMIVSSLINLGPVTINLLVPEDGLAVAGSFLAAAVVTRVPILAFSAVQAVLIPRLVRSVMAGDRQDFRKGLVLVLVPTAALGVLGMLAWVVVGPALLQLLAGDEYSLPRADMVLLAAGVALYLVCVVLQSAAFALGEHVRVMRSWILGAAIFPLVVLLPLEPTRAVGWAMVGAFGGAAVALALVVRRRMVNTSFDRARGGPPTP